MWIHYTQTDVLQVFISVNYNDSLLKADVKFQQHFNYFLKKYKTFSKSVNMNVYP